VICPTERAFRSFECHCLPRFKIADSASKRKLSQSSFVVGELAYYVDFVYVRLDCGDSVNERGAGEFDSSGLVDIVCGFHFVGLSYYTQIV